MFTRSEVIVLTNKQTDAAENIPALFATYVKLRRWVNVGLSARFAVRDARKAVITSSDSTQLNLTCQFSDYSESCAIVTELVSRVELC